MDFKANSLRIQKIIVFFLTVILFTAFIMSAVDIVKSNGSRALVPEYDYLYSNEFRLSTSKLFSQLEEYIYYYRNEENIRQANFTEKPDSMYKSELEALFNNYIDEMGDYDISYDDKDKKVYFFELKNKSSLVIGEDELTSNFYRDEVEEINKIKNKYIDEEITKYENIERELKNIDSNEIVFYASNGKDEIFNSKLRNKEAFKEFKIHLLLDKDGVEIENEKAMENLRRDISNESYNNLVKKPRYAENQYRIYIGFKDSYINEKLNDWSQTRRDWEGKIKILSVLLFALVILFIRLSYLTGRGLDGNVELLIFDRLYTDLNLILCLIIINTWFRFMSSSYMRHIREIWSLNAFSIITFVLGLMGLFLVTSLIRHIKNGTIIEGSLTYKVFTKVFEFLKRIYTSGSAAKKVIFILILYPLVLFLTVLIFPVTIGIAIYLAMIKVKEFEAIKDGVKNIKDGDLEYKIEIRHRGEFKELADDINDISEGLKNAVDNELISERHRTELISNVSHDIRTPLTSIITYVDLLKHEEDGEKKKEYIEVLDQKSKRLKKLIDDLFEASKVTSGNVPVEFSKINIVSLLTQGIGEVNDKIEERELDFIINNSKEELFVNADGGLLWRAIENLLSNIFKYGLKGSRVYIDLEEDEDYVYLTMKNISAYKLNISEKELMERFKRGDESRTSEGSGLGLSIAESLIKLQKGKFFIEIDGDLFKSTIVLAKV